MRLKLFFAGLMFTTFYACKKSTDAPAPAAPPGAVMQFNACECSTDAKQTGEYITAEIDGVPVCFDLFPAGLPDTFPNHLRHGYIERDTGDQYFDNVYMIRNSSDGKWQLGFFLENTHALRRTYHYDLPRTNRYYCEIGEIQLISQEHFAPCSECAGTNSYSYYGRFLENSMKMTVNSFENNIFDGAFSGKLTSKVAKPVTVTNGKFRIRLDVFEQYIEFRNGETIIHPVD